LEALVYILTEQVKEYRSLIELARKKQEALIGNDIKELDKLNKEEQSIIIGVAKLENKRLEIIRSLSEVFGSDISSYTLKEMAELAPEPFQGQLNNVYQELNEVVENLSKINQGNSSLIEQALKIVNFTISTIAQSDREVIYPEKEAKSTKPISRIFDSKV